MILQTKKTLSILFLSYIAAYATTFLETIYPTGSSNRTYLAFFMVVYLLVIGIMNWRYEARLVKKENAQIQFIKSIFISSLTGFILTISLHIFTVLRVESRLLFTSLTWLQILNVQIVIVIYILMTSVALLINHSSSRQLNPTKKVFETRGARAILLFFGILAIATFITYWLSLLSGLSW